ncbi:hypothetical protein JOM56_009831 [Amanita muscaria]
MSSSSFGKICTSSSSRSYDRTFNRSKSASTHNLVTFGSSCKIRLASESMQQRPPSINLARLPDDVRRDDIAPSGNGRRGLAFMRNSSNAGALRCRSISPGQDKTFKVGKAIMPSCSSSASPKYSLSSNLSMQRSLRMTGRTSATASYKVNTVNRDQSKSYPGNLSSSTRVRRVRRDPEISACPNLNDPRWSAEPSSVGAESESID